MKKSLILTAYVSCVLYASDAYIKTTSDAILDGKKVGDIALLTPAKIISENSDKTKIKIEGVIQENYQAKLVKSLAYNEEYVSFAKDDENATYSGDTNPYVKVGDKLEDDYGEIWYKASIELEVPSTNLTKDPDTIYKQAKGLYEQTCSQCHRLHDTTEYTVNQWPSNIESMISSGFVGLQADEKNMIIKYLQQNAKDIK